MMCVPVSLRACTWPRRRGSVTARHRAPSAAGHRPPPTLPVSMCAVPLSSSRVGYNIEAKFTCSSSLLFPIRFTLSTLSCSPRGRASFRKAMPPTSHQAKRRRSCHLVPGFASFERAPSSSCRVSKHLSVEPP
jgi:hypothetical protein